MHVVVQVLVPVAAVDAVEEDAAEEDVVVVAEVVDVVVSYPFCPS